MLASKAANRKRFAAFFMPGDSKKKFQWKEGEVLREDQYEPLGDVRKIGFSKLADGIHANPEKRREARKKKLLLPKPKKGEFFVEESESGIGEFTPSDASRRLIEKQVKDLKGIHRFDPSVKTSPKKK